VHPVALITLYQILAADALPATRMITSSDHPPPGWVSVPPPTTEAEWFCANYSEGLRVAQDGAALEISRFREVNTVVLAIPGGKFVGLNRGEFGGTLEWQDAASKKSAIVLDDNPVALLAAKAGVFVFVGLAHMGMDTGRILKLDRRGTRWDASQILDLGSAPSAIHRLDDETTLVLTTLGVVKVNLRTADRHELFKNKKWGPFLYVNSVVPFHGSIFVGGRRAVIRLAPKNGAFTEEWWVPATCSRKIGKGCKCAP
jgi:hypothetical protein